MLGDINASPESSAAFNDPSYEMADPFPIDPTWLAYTTTRGVAGNYQIWIGNFSSGTTFNLNSWFFGANDSNSNLGPAFFGGITAH